MKDRRKILVGLPVELHSDWIYAWSQLNEIALITKGVDSRVIEPDMRCCWLNEDWDIQGEPFTGAITLKVTQGGIRNRETPKEQKLEFKNDVMPLLCRVRPEVNEQYNGLIICHYSEWDLQKLEFIPNI